MTAKWWLRPALVTPVGLALVCAGMFAVALWRAIIIDPLPAVPAVLEDEMGDHTRRSAAAEPVVAVAVAAAPFRSDRRPPSARYQLPGTTVTRRPVQPPPNIVLTGTMVYPDGGGVALLRVMGRNAVILRVGEVIGDMTLRSVTPEEATFVRNGGSNFVLRVTEGN